MLTRTENLANSRLWLRLALLIALTSWVVGSAFAIEQALTPTDRDLPDFSLQGVDGEVYQPENLIGKTWLINFWAVWCAPCLEELPSLNKAWAQLRDENVGMLAINIGEDADKIEQFLNEHNLRIDFPIVIGDEIRTLGNWSGSGLPFTVIVNPAGKVVYEAVGPREWHDPQFIDTVVALNDTQLTPSFTNRMTSALAKFHAMSTLLKVATIVILLMVVFAPMIIIRMLSQRKSAYKV